MFFGILLRPFRALMRFTSPAIGNGAVPENRKSRLRLRWVPGNDGHPRARWDRKVSR